VGWRYDPSIPFGPIPSGPLTESDVRRIVREEILAAQEDIISAVIQRMVQARRSQQRSIGETW
jgi:hypothetical protein